MARSFTAASLQYLHIEQAVVSAPPLTMACWAYPTTNTVQYCLMQVCDKDTSSQYFGLILRGNEDSNKSSIITIQGAALDVVLTTTVYTANAWQHFCGVWTNSTSRATYYNGGSKGTSSVSVTPVGIDRTTIGRTGDATPIAYMDGFIAEAAIWDVALSDAEVARLYNECLPATAIQPGNLVAYWRLRDDDLDRAGSYHLTPYNSPTFSAHPTYEQDRFGGYTLLAQKNSVAADHPPIIHPSRAFISIPAAAGGLSMAVVMHHLLQRRRR